MEKKQWLYLQTKKPLAPLPGYFNLAVVFMKYLSDVIPGVSGREWAAIYREDKFTVFGNKVYFEKMFDDILDHQLKNPDFMYNNRKMFIEKSKVFLDFCRTLPKDAKINSTEELTSLLNEYEDQYCRAYLYSEPFAWSLKDRLPEYLLEYLRQLKVEHEFEALGILATDAESLSFASREELEMLRLAGSALENQELLETIKSSSSLGEKNKSATITEFYEKFIKHVEEWNWVPYDYGVMTWDKTHFWNELLDRISKGKKYVEEKIKYFENYNSNTKEEQERLIQKYNIGEFHQKQFKALQDSGYILDYKKEVFTKSHLLIRPILEEIAKRIGIPYDCLCYFLPKELEKHFSGENLITPERAKERFHFCIMHSLFPNDHKIITGEEAGELEKNILGNNGEKEDVSTKEIKGQIAMRGKTSGKIKIILDAKNIGDFQEGEVLVTKMTSPDYISGLKKACAVITDEGGITCHAAIVARELKIPCIIGTKNATRILRDGDLVEVDAEAGIVKLV